METNPQQVISGSFKEYYELLMKRFVYFQKIVQDSKLQQVDIINKDNPMTQYKPGDFGVPCVTQNFPI